MSSAEKAAKILPSIENLEFRVLQAIELGMIQHEVVPLYTIEKYSQLNKNELEYLLKKLYENELIYRQSDPYAGYVMNYTGYDVLALNALVKGDYLEGLGVSLGVGKEADVYEALDPERKQVAVKFHRLGRTSFRDTRRKRQYLAKRRHTSWLYQSRLAAEKEFDALKIISSKIDAPQPIQQNRHVIVMSFFPGVPISDYQDVSSPEEVLEKIIVNIKKTYELGIIHSDLSEYNVLMSEEGRISIIDWPQFIRTDHINSDDILERDIKNVVSYFNRKFNVEKSYIDVFNFVKQSNIK